MIFPTPKEQMDSLISNCVDVISHDELYKKIEISYQKRSPLIVKLGADPSAPDLHLGHWVVLKKLKNFQELGHKVVFIIGDFTARIGDPTGRNKMRPPLSAEEIERNAATYQNQVFKILDPQKTTILYNSSWFQGLTAEQWIQLLASKTLQQIIAREDFHNRYHEQSPIFLHELLYPILQAYDSFHLKADVELGGQDQRFNLLLGREFQKFHGQSPQALLLTPLLEGLDGNKKMSKSLGNYIGCSESPKSIFGKLMSITDELMWKYARCLLSWSEQDLLKKQKAVENQSIHPMNVKKDMAESITAQLCGGPEALQERENFENVFSMRALPKDIPQFICPYPQNGQLLLLDLLIQIGFCSSKSEARRILQQRGIRWNGEVLESSEISVKIGETYCLRQGKLKYMNIFIQGDNL